METDADLYQTFFDAPQPSQQPSQVDISTNNVVEMVDSTSKITSTNTTTTTTNEEEEEATSLFSPSSTSFLSSINNNNNNNNNNQELIDKRGEKIEKNDNVLQSSLPPPSPSPSPPPPSLSTSDLHHHNLSNSNITSKVHITYPQHSNDNNNNNNNNNIIIDHRQNNYRSLPIITSYVPTQTTHESKINTNKKKKKQIATTTTNVGSKRESMLLKFMGINPNLHYYHHNQEDGNNESTTSSFITDLDIGDLEEKPWDAKNADTTDWFNYGFAEDSWREYCIAQGKWRKYLKHKSPSMNITNLIHSDLRNTNVPDHTNETSQNNINEQSTQYMTSMHNNSSSFTMSNVAGDNEQKTYPPTNIQTSTNIYSTSNVQTLPTSIGSFSTETPQLMALHIPDGVPDQGTDEERKMATSYSRRKGICFDFQKHGYCRRGNSCRYQHIRDISNISSTLAQNSGLTVRTLGNTLPVTNPIIPNFVIKKASDVCFEFEQKGLCQWGMQCRYKHIPKETKDLGSSHPQMLNPNNPIHISKSHEISASDINKEVDSGINIPSVTTTYLTMPMDIDKIDSNNLKVEETLMSNNNTIISNPIDTIGRMSTGTGASFNEKMITTLSSIPPTAVVRDTLPSYIERTNVPNESIKLTHTPTTGSSLVVNELLGMSVPSIHSIQTQLLVKDTKENINRHKSSQSHIKEEDVDRQNSKDKSDDHEELSLEAISSRRSRSRSHSRSLSINMSPENNNDTNRSPKEKQDPESESEPEHKDYIQDPDQDRDRDRNKDKHSKNRSDSNRSRSRSRHKKIK